MMYIKEQFCLSIFVLGRRIQQEKQNITTHRRKIART